VGYRIRQWPCGRGGGSSLAGSVQATTVRPFVAQFRPVSPARKGQRPSITRCKFTYIDEAIKFILHLTRRAVHLPPPAIKLIKFLPVFMLPLWELVAFVLLRPNLPYSLHCIANPSWISLPLLTQIALSECWVEENPSHVHGGLFGKLVQCAVMLLSYGAPNSKSPW
jgi:hypothetical protein